MKHLLTLLLLVTFSFQAQDKKKLFKDFFKYSTLYVSGDIKNSKENAPSYFVRTNPNGSLYDVPVSMTAPNSAIKGFEYVFHTEKERVRDDVFKNHRYFLKHSGKYHIVKVESRKQGKVNFDYKSAELRAKLPIGKKFSLSAGVMYRTHERPYGYNPWFLLWL